MGCQFPKPQRGVNGSTGGVKGQNRGKGGKGTELKQAPTEGNHKINRQFVVGIGGGGGGGGGERRA